MKLLKIISGAIAVLLLIIVIGAGGLYGFLQTQGGRNTLANSVNQISKKTGQIVSVKHIHGDIFSDFYIDEIRIADKKGVWLEIDGFHFIWKPFLLLKKAQGIQYVEAKTVLWRFLPTIEKKDKEKSADSANFSMKQIIHYLPQNMRIAKIMIDKQLTGHDQVLAFNAKGNAGNYFLRLNTLAGPETLMDANVAINENKINIAFLFNEKAGGVTGRLLKLPLDTDLHASLNVQTDSQGSIHLQNSEFTAGSAVLTANGTLSPDRKAVDGHINLNLPDIAMFQEMAKTTLHGDMQGNLEIKGRLADISMFLKLNSKTLFAAKTQINDLDFRADAAADMQRWNMDQFLAKLAIQAHALVNEQESSLQTIGHINGDAITIEGLIAKYGVYEAKGEGRFDTGTHEFMVNIATNEMQLEKIAPKSKLTGTIALNLDAEGSFNEFAMTSHADIITPHGNSQLNFNGKAENQLKHFAGLLDGELNDAARRFQINAGIEADKEHVVFNDLAVKGPGIDIGGSGAWLIKSRLADANMMLDVSDLAPLGHLLGVDLTGSLKSDIALSPTNDMQSGIINLQKLHISHAGKEIRLNGATSLRLEKGSGVMPPMKLFVAGGMVTVQGKMDRNAVNGKIDLRNIALDHFINSGLSQGIANATLNITGDPASPVIRMTASSTGRSGNYPIRLDVKGDWRGDILHLQANARSREAKADLNADLKASVSLMPFSVAISRQTPLHGNMAANIPLDILNASLWQKGQRVGGLFAGNANLRGTLGAPQMLGRFTLQDGEYTHSDSGICIRGAQAVISGSTKQIVLEHLRATDPKGGSLTANAKLAMQGVKPLDGSITMRNFRLFCGGLATGNIQGNLDVTGTVQSMLLSGKLKLGPMNVQLPGTARGAAKIPEIETIRLKPNGAGDDAKTLSVIKLNIALDAPGQIFVRGRGLDAEFEGDLNITGTAIRPNLAGQFSARRGSFTLLDRLLRLEKGEIRFAGPTPPAPFLDIKAKTKVESTNFEIGLAGPVKEPELTLVSDPSLPRDELLALLLFGRQLQAISPFEALQLAQATRELAGLGDGEPGILDKARSALGLDALDVATDDENNVTVTTGKYITDRVFVGVRQGATPEAREVTTEIELSPAVSANTTLDGEGNQGVGINWRHDY